jgi:Ca-activated chloride channel family protein
MTSRQACLRIVIMLAATVSPLIAQFKSESRLVEVYASVYDQKGRAVDGLAKDRFQILDDGMSQVIYSFESATENLSCAILLDTTGSMRDALASVKNAVSSMLDQMRERDSVAVFGFNSSLTLLQDFTTDKSAAKRAVLRTRAAGQTALFDAIADVSNKIAARPGKKAIVLFTDGADNASRLIPESAINRALQTGVPIYAVAEGEATHSKQLLEQLKRIAERTGGNSYRARTGHEVARIFNEIQDQLSHVYLISYKPPNADGTKWRTIQVTVNGAKNYKIRGKQGYFPN